MKVLCVAEKPSIAKSVSAILSGAQNPASRPGKNKYCRNYEFPFKLDGRAVDVTFTSVLGHLTSTDFAQRRRNFLQNTERHRKQVALMKNLA